MTDSETADETRRTAHNCTGIEVFVEKMAKLMAAELYRRAAAEAADPTVRNRHAPQLPLT